MADGRVRAAMPGWRPSLPLRYASCNFRLIKILIRLQRHINDSCWKVCDECCKGNSIHCDAFNKDGDCSRCTATGRSCTKHMEPISELVPQLLLSESAQPNASRGIKSAVPKKPKRKAITSPDASPQAKSKPKRRTRKVKEDDRKEELDEDRGATVETDNEEENGRSLNPASASAMVRDWTLGIHDDMPPSMRAPWEPTRRSYSGNALTNVLIAAAPDPHATIDLARRNRVPSAAPPTHTVPGYRTGLPQTSEGRLEPARYGLLPPPEIGPHQAQRRIQNDVAGDFSSASLHNQRNAPQMPALPTFASGNYMMPGLGPHGVDLFGALGGHSNENLTGREPWISQEANIAPQYASGYGTSLYQPPVLPSSRMSNVRGGAGDRPLPRRPAHIHIHEDHPEDEFDRLSARPSAPNSHVPSRQGSTTAGFLSVPGSRVPSRQPSRQSSAEQLQSVNALHVSAGGMQFGQDGARMLVKLPLPRELKQEVTLITALHGMSQD